MRPRTPRLALVPSEALRPQMAGIGIRYLELAKRLPFHGFDVVIVTPGDPTEVPSSPAVDVRAFERGGLRSLLADCDVVITQGQLANDVVLELGVGPEAKPVVVDFYDPFLIENFAYVKSLGLDPYRNDHATWRLQLSRGDFFLCSSDEQRQFYLGFLTAVGRVHPYRLESDPDLEGLIAPVPFGVPDEVPEYRPYLEPAEDGERRLLFGGLYDWYDPWPVLKAVEQARDEPWTLLFIRNPNPGTPQELFAEVEAWCRDRGLWDSRVRALDWVPSARRYDLLRDVDLMIATHRLSLETRLSLRTRFLDALAAGCPVITSEGGAMSRLLVEEDAGWVVPEGDSDAVGLALREALGGGSPKAAGVERLVQRFAWDRVLEPLVTFCHEPSIDPDKDAFAADLGTHAPPDPWLFRLRRRLRRVVST
ncbi:MAG: glycosyltransferase family 4 protein [Acidobacteriota bacterium]